MAPTKSCPICQKSDALKIRRTDFNSSFVDCAICGKFNISDIFEEMLARQDTLAEAALVPFLSAYIRAVNSQHVPPPLLTSENWVDYARAHSATPVAIQAHRLLSILGSRGRAGFAVPFDLRQDYPLLV